MEYQKFYHKDLEEFRKAVYSGDYDTVRNNKKLHFWMNTGTIKLSTIHSFKGWESQVVFLVLEPSYNSSTEFNDAFDELVYTAITRARRDLIIVNFGNKEYDTKLRPLIEQIK